MTTSQNLITPQSKHKRCVLNVARRLVQSWQLYLCLAPAVIYLFIFCYLPMYGLQISFRNYMPGLGIRSSPWVGMKHFTTFVRSIQFPILMRNTLLISVYSLIFGFPIPIILALMLHEVKNLTFKKIVQNVTYIPYFISTVVMVAMLINFTSPKIGIINKLLVFLGGTAKDFMGSSESFRSLYVISGIWQSMGWNSIIYLAALAGVDPQLYEAAQIDGANRIRRIWHINLPGIAPTVIMVFILNCGSLLNVGFEKIYLMQNALNIDVSEVISTYVYKVGILNSKFSYTAAIGFFNTVLNFSMLLIVNAITKRISEIGLF
jgi:putative aldouronate transport system permease protein